MSARQSRITETVDSQSAHEKCATTNICRSFVLKGSVHKLFIQKNLHGNKKAKSTGICVCKDSTANWTAHKKNEDEHFECNMSASGSESSKEMLSIMDELDSDDEMTHNTEDLIQWIKALQQKVRSIEENAESNANEMLEHAQMQCVRDTQTYHNGSMHWCLTKYSLSKSSSSIKGTSMISLEGVVLEW